MADKNEMVRSYVEFTAQLDTNSKGYIRLGVAGKMNTPAQDATLLAAVLYNVCYDLMQDQGVNTQPGELPRYMADLKAIAYGLERMLTTSGKQSQAQPSTPDGN